MEKNEEFKFDELENFLKKCKINCWREVVPDQCKNWEHPYQVDLIFELKHYGLIGVEGKHLCTHGQGSKYAEAYLQIRDKYRNRTYFGGKRVRRWCVLGFIESNMGGNTIICFIKNFFNKLGISFLEFSKWGRKNSIVIDYLTKNRMDIKLNNEDEVIIKGDDQDNFLDYGENIK